MKQPILAAKQKHMHCALSEQRGRKKKGGEEGDVKGGGGGGRACDARSGKGCVKRGGRGEYRACLRLL